MLNFFKKAFEDKKMIVEMNNTKKKTESSLIPDRKSFSCHADYIDWLLQKRKSGVILSD